MLEWIIIGGLAVILYVILYKYEKRMERMQRIIDAHKELIEKNDSEIKNQDERIDKNIDRLDEHYNHIEKLWVSSPKNKKHKKE